MRVPCRIPLKGGLAVPIELAAKVRVLEKIFHVEAAGAGHISA
jgi:hypothetical protein